MATIVEYSVEKKPMNAFPAKIVSPPFSSTCCGTLTDRVGEIQTEKGWPFLYHRCTACGYTVRRLAPAEEFLETMRDWRKAERAIPKGEAA